MDGLKQVLQSALDSIERTELGCFLPPANADSLVVVAADRRFHRACWTGCWRRRAITGAVVSWRGILAAEFSEGELAG